MGDLAESVIFEPDPYVAVEGAHAVAVLTEWPQFRNLSVERLAEVMRGNVVVDLRNIWDPFRMEELGLQYTCIGRHPKALKMSSE